MSQSFLDVVPDYLQDGKHQKTLENYQDMIRLVDKALHVLMQEDEEPILVARTFARQRSSDHEYAVYLFFTTRRIYSVYLKRGFMRKIKIEPGIIEYPDIQLKEKGLMFKKMHLVGKYRKIDDPDDKRRRITGLRIPDDVLVTEISRVLQIHHGVPNVSNTQQLPTFSTEQSDPVQLLQELQKLRDIGVLSDEEFSQKKQEILSRL